MDSINSRLKQEYELVVKYEPKFNVNPNFTVYSGILYRQDDQNSYTIGIEITISNNFPKTPPIITFSPNISHSKIYDDRIIHDFFNNWSENNHIWQVIKVIRGLFDIEKPVETNKRSLVTAYKDYSKELTEEEKRRDKIKIIYMKKDKDEQLANLVLEFCNKINKEIDHIITFADFFTLFREYYYTDIVSSDDLIRALKTLAEKKLIIGLKEYLKTLFVVISTFTFSKDIEILLKFLQNKQSITIREIITNLNWDVLRTNNVLKILENMSILRKINKYSLGPVWYVVDYEK